MNTIISAVQDHAGIIAAAACVVCLILIVWVATLTGRLRTVTPQMRHLVRDMEGMNATEMLRSHLVNAEMATRRADQAIRMAEDLSRRQRTSLQRVALVKYNEDENLGGEMSFSAALLDETDAGFILTSIYRLEECRTYAKRVEGGEAQQKLSQEEQQALEAALRVGLDEAAE